MPKGQRKSNRELRKPKKGRCEKEHRTGCILRVLRFCKALDEWYQAEKAIVRARFRNVINRRASSARPCGLPASI